MTDWLTHETKFTYDSDSDLKETDFPSETKDEDKYTYNDADQMTEVKMVKSSETLASLVYTRDSDGQVKNATTKGLPGAEVIEYTYDEDNRVTKAGSTKYKYDAADNPTEEGSSTNTYNEGDELEKGTGETYIDDELGERTKTTPGSGPATTYGYDQTGNLTLVERPKEGEIAKIEDGYAYNGEGLRTSQTVSGATSYLAWDMAEELPLILSDGTNSYIYGPGGLAIEQINSENKPLYLHHDQQGSTRLLTGSAGTKEASMTYGAYGSSPETTGTATTPLGYDGQYTSKDTGFIYLRARTYDPATAQFLSVDPITPISRAPYSYTYDNPVNTIDPTGLFCISLSVSCVKEDAGEAIEVGSRVAATAIQQAPLGTALKLDSEVTGETLGGCAGAGFVGGGNVHVSMCYVSSPHGQSAITYTGGAGGGFPIGASGSVGVTVSNAQSPSGLGKQFYVAGGSVGEGAVSAGGSLAVGCGGHIWQATFGWTPSASFPVPASGYAGTSYTVVDESY